MSQFVTGAVTRGDRNVSPFIGARNPSLFDTVDNELSLAAKLRAALDEAGFGIEEAARRLAKRSSGKVWANERRALYRALAGDPVRKTERLEKWAKLFNKPPDHFVVPTLPSALARSLEERLVYLERLTQIRAPLQDELSGQVARHAALIEDQAGELVALADRAEDLVRRAAVLIDALGGELVELEDRVAELEHESHRHERQRDSP